MRVVQYLQIVEVEQKQCERPAIPLASSDLYLELTHKGAAIEQVRQRIVIGEKPHLCELLSSEKRRRRLVREQTQRLKTIRRRKQAILGLVDPDHTDHFAATIVQRHDQPMVVPCVWSPAVVLRAVLHLRIADACARLTVRHKETARNLERR